MLLHCSAPIKNKMLWAPHAICLFFDVIIRHCLAMPCHSVSGECNVLNAVSQSLSRRNIIMYSQIVALEPDVFVRCQTLVIVCHNVFQHHGEPNNRSQLTDDVQVSPKMTYSPKFNLRLSETTFVELFFALIFPRRYIYVLTPSPSVFFI